MKSLVESELIFRIPFHDVDSMNVVWHGNYIKYFEMGRTEILRAIGCDMPQFEKMGYFFPVIDCHARYMTPAVYDQEILIRTKLTEAEYKMKFTYSITCAKTNKRLVRGSTEHAVIDKDSFKVCLPIPIEVQKAFGISKESE